MKKYIILFTLGLILSACQESQKIGFVDNGMVINEYQEKVDIEIKYKGREETFQRRRDSLVGAYNLELEEARIKSQNMSQANLQKLSQELQQKEALLGQKLQFEQQQIQQAYSAEIDSVITKVRDFVKDYGKKNGYTYILGTSDASSSVMYGTNENDLSQIILDALNASYKN